MTIVWTDDAANDRDRECALDAMQYAERLKLFDRMLSIRRTLRESKIDVPAQYESARTDPRRV